MDEKLCRKCNASKPHADYYRDASKADGLTLWCRECQKAKDKAYREANRDKVLARKKAYREANREILRAKNRDHYKANRECVNAKSRAEYAANSDAHKERGANYREANREALRAKAKAYRETPAGKAAKANYKAKRRTRMRGTDITNSWLADLRANATSCPLCKVTYTDGNPYAASYRNLDHVLPLAAGGTHTMDNVRYICFRCNTRRPKDGSDLAG